MKCRPFRAQEMFAMFRRLLSHQESCCRALAGDFLATRFKLCGNSDLYGVFYHGVLVRHGLGLVVA